MRDLAHGLHMTEVSIVEVFAPFELKVDERLVGTMDNTLGKLLQMVWNDITIPTQIKILVTFYAAQQAAFFASVGKQVKAYRKIEAEKKKHTRANDEDKQHKGA